MSDITYEGATLANGTSIYLSSGMYATVSPDFQDTILPVGIAYNLAIIFGKNPNFGCTGLPCVLPLPCTQYYDSFLPIEFVFTKFTFSWSPKDYLISQG